MNEPHLDRIGRAAHETAARELDALVVSPSPDLAYLTGYDPMPLERPTLLVLRPNRDPVMLVPELERAPAAASPVGEHLELVPWRDGQDPYEAAVLQSGAARIAWRTASGLSSPRPPASASRCVVRPCVPGDGPSPRRQDEHDLGALRRAGRAAD